MKKNMIKLIIIGILLIVIALLLSFLYLNFIREDKVAVLTFHNIVDEYPDASSVDINVDTFEKKIKWLAKHNYTSLSLDELYDYLHNGKKISRKSILLTFDDGWESFYTKAIPILEKYNMKGTVFVIFKYSDNSSKTGDHFYMTKKQIEDIKKNHPLVTISSHSYGLHEKEKADSNDYDVYNEDLITVNTKYIEGNQYYAYPYGRRNKNYISALKDNHYRLAFTFGPYDFVSKDSDDYELPRIGIFESTKDWKFKLKMFLEM